MYDQKNKMPFCGLEGKLYPTGVKVEHGIPLEEPLRLHAVVIVAEDG